MIQLPDGFDISALVGDFFHLAAPLASIACLIACGFLIVDLIKRADP